MPDTEEARMYGYDTVEDRYMTTRLEESNEDEINPGKTAEVASGLHEAPGEDTAKKHINRRRRG